MVIITWKQKEGGAHRRGETYTMRAVVKPINARTDPAFVVEREHTDAAGGKGWVPANHTYATAIICKALLQLAGGSFDEHFASRRGMGLAARDAAPMTLDLGLLDLPEE